MRVIVVTSNMDKFNEIAATLKNYGIKAEQRTLDTPELGETLEEIVREKAEQAFSLFQSPVLTDDTGMFFKEFTNFPGARSKRVFQEMGFQKILKTLEGRDRHAFFKCAICYKDGQDTRIFVGTLEGRIAEEVHPSDRYKQFPYMRIFIPHGMSDPICTLEMDQIIKFDHRSQAVRKFAEYYVEKYDLKNRENR